MPSTATDARISSELKEGGSLISQQISGVIEFFDSSLIQHHDLGVIENRVDSMGDGDDGARGKLLANRGL